VESALDYLIGEKLMTYAETAITRPEFARELPRFVAEIRSIFNTQGIRLHLEHLERMHALEDEELSTDLTDDDVTIDTPEQRAAVRERPVRLKELLTSTILGTA
jgi:hypothetical protein